MTYKDLEEATTATGDLDSIAPAQSIDFEEKKGTLTQEQMDDAFDAMLKQVKPLDENGMEMEVNLYEMIQMVYQQGIEEERKRWEDAVPGRKEIDPDERMFLINAISESWNNCIDQLKENLK